MLDDLKQKIKKAFKSFYFVASLIFIIWMIFFDNNDFLTQRELSEEKEELLKLKEFYENKIVEVKNDRETLLNSNEMLEKIAREKYFMKKKGEDIFVIVKEDAE